MRKLVIIMSDKVCCQPYIVDYKQVYEKTIDWINDMSKDLCIQLHKETNAFRYIEIKMAITTLEDLRESINRFRDNSPIKEN